MPTFDITIQGKDYTVDAPSEEALPEIVDTIAKENPQGTSASELAGAAVRGLGPVGVGAAAGALVGAPLGPPGAATGARAGAALVELGGLAADVGVMAINKMLGTRYNLPTEAWNGLWDKMGIPEAKSDTAKMVEQSAKMVASTVGGMGLGSFMKGAASPTVAKIGGILTEAPKAQLAAGAAAGATGEYARQAVEEAGGGEGMQAAASFIGALGGGLAGGRLAALKAGAGAAANPVIQAAERFGIDLSTSMVNEPKSLVGKYVRTFGSNVPLFGTVNQMEKVAGQRVDAVYDFLKGYGIDYGVSPDAKAAVMESLTKGRADRLNSLVRQKTSIIDPLAASGLDVPVNKTVAAINAEIARLTRINPDAYSSAISELNSFKANIVNKTLDNVEGNRAVLRNMFKSPELANIRGEGEKAANSVYKALRQDMGDFIETQAGSAAKSSWQKADAELAGMVQEIDKTSLKSVLRTGAATPEVVGKLLFSKKDSELNLLLSNLDAAGRDNAKAAILQEIANRSIDKRTGVISPSSFTTKLNEMSRPMAKIFTMTEMDEAKGLAKVLEKSNFAALFAPDAPTGVKTIVPQSAALFMGSMFGVLKVAGAGLAWRAYESKAVRNMLQKIAKDPVENVELIKRAGNALQVGFVRKMGDEMINKGIPITFAPGSVQTEQLGKGSVSTDAAHGYRTVSKDGNKHRLYGPGNELIGVFPSLDDARLYADQQVVSKIRIPKY